jgi:predicted ABC-type transport system involved in lysophospholipase L1 biosynthesis ATPase subunit
VARALVNDPRILLADEPTGSVDTATGEKLLDLFDEVNRERGVTTVVITHNDYVARRAQRVVRVVDGRVSEEVRPAEAAP